MTSENLDIIIFGATGFTGKHTVKVAERICKTIPFTWGVAGRNKERLEEVLKEFAPDSQNIPIIIADIKNDESLVKMAEKCKVIVSCCGPYRFYGEPVVKACVAAKTNYVDVSGEPQFLESMQIKYNKAAADAGIYIVGACGFDSIPCDLGVIFVQQNFGGDVNSVETYLNSWQDGETKGPSLNFGTWESLVNGIAHMNELQELRAKLYPEKLPKFSPKLEAHRAVHRSNVSDGWSVPFPGADRSVVYRSQRYLYEKHKMRPAQVQTYVTFKSFVSVFAVACFGIVLYVFTRCKCGQNLLLKYPKFFSVGVASREGPSLETMEKTHFSITFKAHGWKEKLAEPTDKHTGAPNKEVIAKVTGVNPGYGATCIMLMFSALTILRESSKMPDNGGVIPPGAAFANTSLIQQLKNNGITFDILKSTDI